MSRNVFSSDAPFKPGDRVRTNFHRKEFKKVRLVSDIHLRNNHQNTVFSKCTVSTTCGLHLDSDWFELVIE